MDTAVKQRLLGGIVLAAGAAILLPLMLDGSGARLLSRLEPIPAKPATAPVAEAQPKLNQQQQEAEDAVDAAHSEDTQFYSVGKPAEAALPAVAKPPEQIAAEQAARERAAQLLSSTDEISVEEAQAQKQAADKAERELLKQQAVTPAPADVVAPAVDQDKLAADKAKKLEAEKALAYLEGKDSQAQKIAEKQAADKAAKVKAEEQAKAEKIAADKDKAEQDKADRLAAEKAKADAKKKDEEKARLALEGKKTDDKVRADKAAAEKAAADKADKLAADKAAKAKAEEQAKADKIAADKEKAKADQALADKAKAKAEKDKADKLAADKAKADAKKKEEEKARLALEDKKDKAKDAGSQAWVVQVASVSDKAKADALSAKLSAKGYRSRVVKNGDSWKVVVGPELQKDAANSLKSKLAGESALGVTGAWIAPWKP